MPIHENSPLNRPVFSGMPRQNNAGIKEGDEPGRDIEAASATSTKFSADHRRRCHGGLGWLARPRRASAAAAGRVVAGGFAGQAAAADHEFTLELRFVGLVRRLLLLPLVLRSNPVILLGRRNIERGGDFPLRSRLLLWPKLKRLGFLRRGRAKPVPCDRAPGRGCTTASRRAAIGQHQRGNEERDAFRNHRNSLTVRQLKTRWWRPTLARPHRHIYATGQTQKPSSARPTQLNANIEQPIAATDAKVAIALTDRMTRTPCR
jgi:hypothetical protein